MARGSVLVFGLVFGITLGAPVALSNINAPVATAALTLFVDDVAAQVIDIDAENCGFLAILCNTSESDGGDGGNAASTGGDGGNGGRGGFATVHDVGNAWAQASVSVIIDDIATGDAIAHEVNVDARGATDPVVLAVAGSFPDTGVDVFAPGGSAQAGTTGGNGVGADASGGDGGDGGDSTATGGGGGGGGGISQANILSLFP